MDDSVIDRPHHPEQLLELSEVLAVHRAAGRRHTGKAEGAAATNRAGKAGRSGDGRALLGVRSCRAARSEVAVELRGGRAAPRGGSARRRPRAGPGVPPPPSNRRAGAERCGAVTLRGAAQGRAAGSDMWGRADKAVKLLERNIPSFLRMSRGVGPKVSRRLCSKPQEESSVQPRGRPVLRVPGHKPTDWEKKCLLWAGHFKKPEDIPEVVSIDTIRAAQTTLRVKFSYVMIALTIVGCIVMVIRGKQAVKRHESLTSINLEKKAQWKEEATQSTSAKP